MRRLPCAAAGPAEPKLCAFLLVLSVAGAPDSPSDLAVWLEGPADGSSPPRKQWLEIVSGTNMYVGGTCVR